MTQIIEAAYLSGFEPSSDNLSTEEIYEQAEKYLFEEIAQR